MKSISEICDMMVACCGMQDVGRLLNIGHLLMQTSHIPGSVVEFGTHQGKLAVFMASLTDKTLYVYDSFQGLPERSAHDVTREDFFPGQLKVDSSELFKTFAKHKMEPPLVRAGWFKDLKPDDVPGSIAFAMLDGDFFSSIMDSLALVYPRLWKGGICVIDDYGWPALPGVKVAVDSFLRDKPEKIYSLYGQCGELCSHVYFTKQ